MLERLTDPDEIEDAERRIRELIEAHGEWVYARAQGGAATTLRKGEIDLRIAQNRLIFSCWTEKGVRSWRVRSWEWTGEKLLLEATRRAGAERSRLELVPRLSTKVFNTIISAARRERAQYLARLACACAEGAKIERVALSAGARRGLPGRYARVLLRMGRERIAVTGVVAPDQAYDLDAFLSSTLIWFTRAVGERTSLPSVRKLWLVADWRHAPKIAERVALWREDLRRAVSLFMIDDEWRTLCPVRSLEQAELWTARSARFLRPSELEPSEWAARIVALAPHAIDVVRARHGETLRFHGLPFARVRRVMGDERVWFGVAASARRLLDESTTDDWAALLRQLSEHRRADPIDRRHTLYKLAPEAWLESMLRRDITQLDPGLILSPLYAQFRAAQDTHGSGARPVDLLALRRDGRLVVIELKVSEDREHVLQAADYWRRVEAHRRWGNLLRARLFGDAVLADQTPLVYLVAPTLSFHPAFATLARAIDPRIEIYRFDLNEDWRASVRVMRRTQVNSF